jgi:hypothetical protein
MEFAPEYVRAIGMISIENANMELALAALFSRIIQVQLKTGRAIYLTPKSAVARTEIFENAAKAALDPEAWHGNKAHHDEMRAALNKTLNIIERAKTAIGKRHGIMHDQWGVNIDTDEVERRSLGKPAKTDGVVSVETLESLIASMRAIICEARELAAKFRTKPPQMVDMRIDA